jgi:hypothetical protein
MPPRVFRNEVFESGHKKPTARIVDEDNNVLTQADFTGSVLVRVFDLSIDPTTAILSNTRTIAATVHNSLQDWEVDGDGFNFQDTVTSNEANGWPGDHTIRISYLLTKTTGGYLPVAFEVRSLPLFSL